MRNRHAAGVEEPRAAPEAYRNSGLMEYQNITKRMRVEDMVFNLKRVADRLFAMKDGGRAI